MNVLIIEDEPLAASKLEGMLSKIDGEIRILETLESVEESIAWLRENESPDVIFSDIHLNDGICFSIYSEVEVTCPIIFTTAYEKYAIQAFEVNSIDYLLKPIQAQRLEQAMDKLGEISTRQSLNKSILFEEFRQILTQANRAYKERFLCKLGNKIKSIPTERIRYFYSKDKITFIVDSDGNRYPINNTLDEIDQSVDPKYFFRINRKYITHYESIDVMAPYFKGRLKVKLSPAIDDDIVVSTERSPLFKSWLDR